MSYICFLNEISVINFELSYGLIKCLLLFMEINIIVVFYFLFYILLKFFW